MLGPRCQLRRHSRWARVCSLLTQLVVSCESGSLHMQVIRAACGCRGSSDRATAAIVQHDAWHKTTAAVVYLLPPRSEVPLSSLPAATSVSVSTGAACWILSKPTSSMHLQGSAGHAGGRRQLAVRRHARHVNQRRHVAAVGAVRGVGCVPSSCSCTAFTCSCYAAYTGSCYAA